MSEKTSVPPEGGQGNARGARERMPMPDWDTMSEAQRAAAQALIDGPRKGVYGPFLPLLRTPDLLDRVARFGEQLRFGGQLPADVRELVTCAVARHVSNQFEWGMHAPLARQAGVSAEAIEALRVGARPKQLTQAQACALDFVDELARTHGVCDATYAGAVACFGESGTVELTTLAGYFLMVSWVMNVARTPARVGGGEPGLDAFPA